MAIHGIVCGRAVMAIGNVDFHLTTMEIHGIII
jgi:hypothetical protein